MSAREVQVGDSVLVNNKHKAIVRYVGGTNFADGAWYGLELERAIGKHEGTVLGVTYFVAPRKHGTFVRRENLSLYDQEVEASVRVQGALRMSIARRRARNELTQRAFNALDADEEARLLRRRQQLMNSALGARLMRERASLAQLEEWEREAAAMPAPSTDAYTGPHLTFPLTGEQVLGMLDAFRDGRILHYKYAMQLICAYRRYAAELPTLVELPMEPGTRLTVCGDTHGQLNDLFSIFALNGVPSPTNRYLMNGDFVDRGDCSCEIVFTLLAFCLLYPGDARTSRGAGCVLNRGNHESHNQNVTGGFLSEVLDKYSAFTIAGGGGSGSGSGASSEPGAAGALAAGGDDGDAHLDAEHGMRLYDACQAAFDAMPLAHLLTPVPASAAGDSPSAAAAAAASTAGAGTPRAAVKSLPATPAADSDSRKVFVVHGGLMQHPGVTLAHVAAVRRQREIPFGFPAFEDKLYEDLMWSDPRPPNGTTPSDRGAGVFWGPDVSERFCATNGVSLVVRSHECVSEGFQLMHDGRVMTVFSASHYCGRGVNKGAFLTFKPNLEHTVRTYVALPLHETAPAAVPPASIDAATAARYQVSTPVEAGVLSLSGAMHGLVHPLPLSVSMEDGSERAAWPLPLTGAGAMPRSPGSGGGSSSSSSGGSISSSTSSTSGGGQAEEVRRMIMERVILAKHDLYVAFAALDRAGANDGTVTRAQWADCMRSVLKLDLPWVSLAPLLCSVDPATARINYSRFLDRYRIALPESHLSWMKGIVERACEKLASACGSLEAAFAHFDTDGSGVIEFEELERGFSRMDIGLSRPQLVELMNAIDSDRDGRIQYSEFAARFKLLFASKLDAAAGTVMGPAVSSLRSLTLSGGASSPATLSLRGSSAVDGSLLSGGSGSGRGTPASAGSGGSSSSSSSSTARLPVPDAWTRDTLRRVGVALLCDGGGDVSEAFKLFDSDRDGLLSSDEFCGGMHKLGLGLTDAEVSRLLAFVDANHSGSVSLVEFADAFAAAGVVTAAAAPPVAPVAPIATPAASAAAAAASRLSFGGASSPRGAAAGKAALLPGAAAGLIPGAFSPGPTGATSAGGSPPPTCRADSLGSFRLSFGGKSAASSAASSPRSSPAASPVAFGGAGAASASPASSAGAPGASGAGEGRPWQQGVIESLVATLFEWRTELAAAFRLFDTDGNGSIDREEFRAGLAALSSLSGASITDMQADELMRALDKDGNGSIDYEEFVSAFRLVDREGTAGPVAPHSSAAASRSFGRA